MRRTHNRRRRSRRWASSSPVNLRASLFAEVPYLWGSDSKNSATRRGKARMGSLQATNPVLARWHEITRRVALVPVELKMKRCTRGQDEPNAAGMNRVPHPHVSSILRGDYRVEWITILRDQVLPRTCPRVLQRQTERDFFAQKCVLWRTQLDSNSCFVRRADRAACHRQESDSHHGEKPAAPAQRGHYSIAMHHRTPAAVDG